MFSSEYPTRDLIFLCIHTRLKARVYTRKNQVTNGTPRENIAWLIYPMPLIELIFLFDVWFFEFKIKVKTGVFFFHVSVVDSIFL